MPARTAYPMIYAALTSGRSDDDRLKIDALLGDEDAEAELESRRVRTASDLGIEVG